MTKLTETTQDCPALAKAILPNGQILFCQFDDYDELKNFQIESGGKPCLVQYDRDNNVKLIQHNYLRESLDWRKEWDGYDMYLERPWHFLQVMFNADMFSAMDTLYSEMKKSNWETPNTKRLIMVNFAEKRFDITEITYPVVNQTIGQGLNESMGVVV